MYSLNNYINTHKIEIKSIKSGTHKNKHKISGYTTAWSKRGCYLKKY